MNRRTRAHLVMPGCAVARVDGPAQGVGEDGRDVFERYVDLMYRRRQVRAAFESCVIGAGFRDHHEQGRGGRASAANGLAAKLADQELEVEILHCVFERGIGMLHLAVRAPGADAATRRVEILRVEDGRIVEHWSVAP